MSKHVCRDVTMDGSCICHGWALEPHDDCPKHGYPWPPRCWCGKFVPFEAAYQARFKPAAGGCGERSEEIDALDKERG